MTELRTSQVLNKAADLIEERGWIQGKGWNLGGDEEGPLCIEGALTALLGFRYKHECPAYVAVARYVDGQPGNFSNPKTGLPIMFWWNDTPGRTQAEVIETLRACALVEAAKEDAALADDLIALLAAEPVAELLAGANADAELLREMGR